MAIAQSRVTAQGQISVPMNVRRKLGVGPGSVLEWEEEKGRIVVRRAGRFTSQEIHKSLFAGKPPKAHDLKDLKEGVSRDIRRRHRRP